MKRTAEVRELLARNEGILKLQPEFVQRFYFDMNRLGQRKLKTKPSQSIPERWIGSSVQAINPPPMPSGGLSMIDVGPRRAAPLSLRDAIKAAPRETIGEQLLQLHGPELRVLVKVLDPGEPIVFHVHATDRQVKTLPRHFRGHRFGKDEAYYFLEAPKGPMPYTHVGLYPGVTRKQLVDAVRKGREYALELSPSLYQKYEEGFFVPAGLPHRPGTALTLEIQQPSDVYTLLETRAAGKEMPPQQIHPGFKTLDEAFELIDLKLAEKVGKFDGYALSPTKTDQSARGGEVAWIYPLATCKKFGGKRLRVTGRLTYREDRPLVLWIWKGQGTINGRRAKAGDEFFVSYGTATTGIELASTGDETFEAFTFFPGE